MNNNIINTIKFYLNINGALNINKLHELLEKTNINITKEELKTYLKELNLKTKNSIIYINDLAYDLDQQINFSKDKEKSFAHAIYTLTEIDQISEELERKDYIDQLYNQLKSKISNSRECFKIAETIFDYSRSGYNMDENINKLFKVNNLKGTKKELNKLNKLIQEIYENTPSWELNGYRPIDKEIKLTDEEIGLLLSYINMYLIMNGAIEIDKLLDILTKEHHYNITKDNLIELSQLSENTYIENNYFHLEDIDGQILKGLIDQKNKFPKYKIITNLDKFFEEHDIMEEKQKKLISKYTDNQQVISQIISLIILGGINEYTLAITLNANKVKLPDNKKARMFKDLDICQKNVRIWSLNGYTMNELTKQK